MARNIAYRSEFDLENSSFAHLALDADTASHLLYELLAYAQPKPSPSLIVFLIFIKSRKIDEKLFKALCADALTLVFDANRKLVEEELLVVLNHVKH